MKEKTQKQMIQETHQGIFGVEGTDDKGLIGDVKEVKEILMIQNSRIRSNEKGISRIKGVGLGLGIIGALGGIGVGIFNLIT